MSVKATERAWESEARGNDLLVYLALADHAGGEDDPYGHAYPAVATLERMTRLSRRTVQRCLRSLEDAGHVKATGEHVWGRGKATTIYRVEDTRGGVSATGRHSDAASPEVLEGASPVTPNPSTGTTHRNGTNAHARDSVPEDFPDDLRPHAREVMRVLRSVAEERGARRVTARAVALTITPRRTKPLVKAAHDCAAWIADHPETPCRDVLARYRRWLDREPDLACVEPLADDGMPSAAKSNGVTRLRPRQSEREKREAGQQWSTFRNMGRMQGMTDAEASAYASQQVGG